MTWALVSDLQLRNIISFVLGMLGVLVVAFTLMMVLAMIIFVPIVLGLISGLGMEGMIQFFTSFATTWSTPQGALMFGAFMLLAMFILGPFFVAFGALFGMAREIVESEGTTAGGVFAWYRKRFFSLAGGGIILFTIVLGPMIPLFIWVPGFATGSFVGPTAAILTAAFTLWVIVSAGMLSLLFPGIIDGLSALGAAKQSLRLSWRYFDRVFSTWLSFVGILLVTFVPAIVVPMFLGYSGPWVAALGTFSGIMAIVDVVLVVPAMAIALSRVYLILTDNVGGADTVSSERPDFRLVGGV